MTTSASADRRLRDLIEGDLRRRVRRFRAEAQRIEQCSLGPVRSAPGAGPCELEIQCHATLTRADAVSVPCEGYEGLGGAHPTKLFFTINAIVDGDSVRPVTVDDFAVDERTRRAVLARALRALPSQHGEGLADFVDAAGSFNQGTRAAWLHVTPHHVVVTFDVFPFAIGPRSVTLPRAAMAPLFRPDAGPLVTAP